MMTINKQSASTVQKDLLAAIDEVCKKHNLTRGKSALNYGDMFKFRVDLTAVGGMTKEQIAYKRWARSMGLPDLGSRFNNNKYEIVGMRVGGPYKSLLYKDLISGKRYRIQVKTAMQLYPDLRVSRF